MKRILSIGLCLVFSLILLIWCTNNSSRKNKSITTAENTENYSEVVELNESNNSDVLEENNISNQSREIVSSMALTEKIYQLFVVTPEQLTGDNEFATAGEITKQALANHPVGGIIYFSKNIVDKNQVTEMIHNMQSFSKIGLFIAVDEEGGTVSRIASNSNMGTTVFPNMSEIKTTEEAYQVGNTIGSEIRELGFNLDFAPVADVNSNPNNPVIGKRAFSNDPIKTSNMIRAIVEGFHDAKICCTLKHFPGHGDTETDSHYGTAESLKTLEELWKTEFIPFQEGIDAGAEFVMIGHVTLPNVTGNNIPATLSPEIVDILKDDLSFEGIIITDSMQMEAITSRWNSDTAAVMAIKAGVDMILMPDNLESAIYGILNAVQNGEISEERINQTVEKIINYKLEKGIISTN